MQATNIENHIVEAIQRLKQEIAQLRVCCAELYQVIGTMAEHCPDPEAAAIIKALDNASDAANGCRIRHADLLPFVLPEPGDPAK